MTAIKVVCLLGATGTGKTDAALALADAFNGGVVNVDSRQVYAGLEVITAQPTVDEQGRCPHFLYGDTPLDVPVRAGDFARRARFVVASLVGRGHVPLLVGGTGLYFRAILGGLAPIPPVPPEVRVGIQQAYDRQGAAAMHDRLAAVDPEYAARIAPADRQRVTRALEVQEATGRSLSEWHRLPDPQAPDYDVFKIGLGLPMDSLAPRLSQRIEAMVAAGAVDEIRRALERYPADVPGLSGIGSPELAAHLDGEIALDAAIALWLANTRAYAKRQMTWFRKEDGVRWFAPDDHEGMRQALDDWLGRDAR